MDSLAAVAGINAGRKNRVVFLVHSITGSAANDVILIDMGGESRKWVFFTHAVAIPPHTVVLESVPP